jgi:hypothetical protein
MVRARLFSMAGFQTLRPGELPSRTRLFEVY